MTKQSKIVLLIIFILFGIAIPNTGKAGKIYDTFESGLFGTNWDSNLREVKKILPDGTLTNIVGTDIYTISDGRKIFDTERQNNNEISFHFDAYNRLVSISIEFPAQDISKLGELYSKLETFFGTNDKGDNQTLDGAVVINWPEDKGFALTLTRMQGTIFTNTKLIVGVHKRTKQITKTKKDMGLE